MPGGFTWADAFAGFSDAVLAGVSIGAVLAAVVVACLAVYGLGVLALHRLRFNRPVVVTPEDAIRAMAHERLAQHSALPYTDEPVFEDWPETTDLTHRRAS